MWLLPPLSCLNTFKTHHLSTTQLQIRSFFISTPLVFLLLSIMALLQMSLLLQAMPRLLTILTLVTPPRDILYLCLEDPSLGKLGSKIPSQYQL